MRYRSYARLLAAAQWLSFDLRLLDPGLVEISKGDLVLWVDVPFLDVEAGDRLRVRKGRLSADLRQAFGITGIDWRFFKR